MAKELLEDDHESLENLLRESNCNIAWNSMSLVVSSYLTD